MEQQKQITISDVPLEQLKIVSYDKQKEAMKLNNEIQLLEQEINKREGQLKVQQIKPKIDEPEVKKEDIKK
jgi:hypothetical protein